MISKIVFSCIPVSERGLLHSGFTQVGNDWNFANLIVFGGNGYYYYNLKGEQKKIRNMQHVGNLVYGVTPFLDMSQNG